MGEKQKPYSWIDDFSLVLTPGTLQHYRRDQEYEVFASSKPLSILWLAVIAAIAGGFGGLLVSGALWRSLLQVPVWLAAFVGFCYLARKAALARSGPYLAFLTSWCCGWGWLIGMCAMWAAQRSSGGWALGIALGIGFLIGITQGGHEPEDFESRDGLFGLSMLFAPIGAWLASWLYRNGLHNPGTLQAAALTGGLAGLIFLSPSMAFLLVRLKNARGLERLARLLLHRDETAAEALPVLDTAGRLAPDNHDLIALRALAYALAGRDTESEAEWTRHASLSPRSSAREIAQGWVHLRRNRPAEAATAFERARARKRSIRAAVGLGVSHLRQGDGAAAVAALEQIAGESHDAGSMTHLAEAYLVAGDARKAIELADVAIDEFDSIHGRSWLVRGDARRALGDLDGAARDYNKALEGEDEAGIEERALARLAEIDRPVTDLDTDD